MSTFHSGELNSYYTEHYLVKELFKCRRDGVFYDFCLLFFGLFKSENTNFSNNKNQKCTSNAHHSECLVQLVFLTSMKVLLPLQNMINILKFSFIQINVHTTGIPQFMSSIGSKKLTYE